jgi:Chalcone isomerase-like
MLNFKQMISMTLLLLIIIPVTALAITEPKTETTYEDEMTINGIDMVVTGVALREKTFMKVDVYTIVSYVKKGASLGENKAATLLSLEEPKMLQMDLTRGFSNEKLKKAFSEVIEENYEDMSLFESDMETFLGYFTADAEEGDKLIFGYCPAEGLTTTLNGTELGVITNVEFMKALWTVWFGEEPANKDMREKLVAAFK